MQHILIKHLKRQNGFTLTEIAIIAPLMIVVALSIVTVLITLVSSTIGPNARSILLQQTEKAFDTMETDINNSSGLLSGLPVNFADSASSDYTTPPTGTKVLRIATYDQIVNPNDTTGTKTIPAFRGGAPCSNATALDGSNIVSIVVVYFVRDNNLYRRTLTDSSLPATCGTKLAKQTCSTCSSEDLKLIESDGFTTFDVEYYTGITNDIVTNDPTVARSAKITIASSLDAGGETVSYSATLRAARLNN